ncbi:hypothetical protein [Pseudochrobactrum saccharolyticum]|uniref:Uncharacterized protein n=1 Tax=Pseudochrobactrum saccharolyticum TaxID=354352 RepID=A0A7W8AKH9_9HYPH|nr:hypothetical protein [Pseudochrobactrum saccharolyticum]MBB5092052.1 hypothetical protein [Pseudochrobactrum saccharolyticum]MDP8250110.1 hypothetical protein [Pseudochrobactrum saccharolyticum]
MFKSLSGAAILMIALSGMYLAGTAGYGGLAKRLFDFYSLPHGYDPYCSVKNLVELFI